MANTGSQPTAAELAKRPEARGSYGPRLFFEKRGDAIALLTETDTVLAEANGTHLRVDLEHLDPLTVPYVNQFVAASGQRVEKYWRTKRYRIVNVQSTTPVKGPILEAAPETDILDALLASTSPRDQARQLSRLAILIHAAANALDEKAGTVTAMEEEAAV